jgi:hypothetical protein
MHYTSKGPGIEVVFILAIGFLFILLLCWMGYIEAFTKVSTMYRIYHIGIHLLHHSPLRLHLKNT